MFCLFVFSWRRHFFSPPHLKSRSVEKQTQIMSSLNLNSNSGSCHELSTLTKKETCVPDPLERIYCNKNNTKMCTRYVCICVWWNCLFPRLSFTCHSSLTRSLMTFLRYYGIESTTKTQRASRERCLLHTIYMM